MEWVPADRYMTPEGDGGGTAFLTHGQHVSLHAEGDRLHHLADTRRERPLNGVGSTLTGRGRGWLARHIFESVECTHSE